MSELDELATAAKVNHKYLKDVVNHLAQVNPKDMEKWIFWVRKLWSNYPDAKIKKLVKNVFVTNI